MSDHKSEYHIVSNKITTDELHKIINKKILSSHP